MIREEVIQLKDELVKVGVILTDDVPNKEQFGELMTAAFGIVKEGADFASIPKEERAKAIALAFGLAGAAILNGAITFSDETP